ncbi:MAG: pyruvate kinase alpha/beta domain-containing protein [Candidatus Jordarchaeaceae archaeon]
MTVKTITYFERCGPANTDETLKLSHERAADLAIHDFVIASTHGKTALKAAEILDSKKNNIVVVTHSESFQSKGWAMTEKEKESLREKGIKVLTCNLALGDDVASAFSKKYGGTTINKVISETLYRFCQGMKVAVEIVLMAADAGLIPVEKEVIAIAGTGEGADTSIVVKPSYPSKFFELKIKEIIAKPREG